MLVVREGDNLLNHESTVDVYKTVSTKRLACMHGLLSVHGAVVVNGHAKRLISGSFPDVVIFLPLGTWTAHSHSIGNLHEKKVYIYI